MDEHIALGIAIGDINPITMEPVTQAKEKMVETRSSSSLSYRGEYCGSDFSNDPFACNPFDSNNLVDTTKNQEDYVANVPLLFEKDFSETNRQICTNLTSKMSNPLSYYQSSSNHEEKIFEMKFIEPLGNNDKSSQPPAQKIRVLVACREICSSANLDEVKQMNYNNAEMQN